MKPKSTKPQKARFETHISIDATQKDVRILKSDLKKRTNWLMQMMCDFSTSVNVRFCGEEEIQKLNFQYRKKNYATDVLSFPVSPTQSVGFGNPKYVIELGDILICIPVCAKQARKARHSLGHELEKMLIHGIVHLKGFDHERGEDAWKIMSNLEKNLYKALERKLGQPSWCQEK